MEDHIKGYEIETKYKARGVDREDLQDAIDKKDLDFKTDNRITDQDWDYLISKREIKSGVHINGTAPHYPFPSDDSIDWTTYNPDNSEVKKK